jgi:hypothetical protein
LDRNHRQFADGYRRYLDLRFGDLGWIWERRFLLELTSTCESPWARAFLRAAGAGCVAIAGTGRVGTRERTGAAIGAIYVIFPAVFEFRKFHEDWGGASPTETR